MNKKFAELDKRIAELEDKVFEKHNEYNALADELAHLLDERYPERKTERTKDALYEAYIQSGRSLGEIIDLIQEADSYI